MIQNSFACTLVRIPFIHILSILIYLSCSKLFSLSCDTNKIYVDDYNPLRSIRSGNVSDGRDGNEGLLIDSTTNTRIRELEYSTNEGLSPKPFVGILKINQYILKLKTLLQLPIKGLGMRMVLKATSNLNMGSLIRASRFYEGQVLVRLNDAYKIKLRVLSTSVQLLCPGFSSFNFLPRLSTM